MPARELCRRRGLTTPGVPLKPKSSWHSCSTWTCAAPLSSNESARVKSSRAGTTAEQSKTTTTASRLRGKVSPFIARGCPRTGSRLSCRGTVRGRHPHDVPVVQWPRTPASHVGNEGSTPSRDTTVGAMLVMARAGSPIVQRSGQRDTNRRASLAPSLVPVVQRSGHRFFTPATGVQERRLHTTFASLAPSLVPVVQRSGHRFFTPATGVRFPPGIPLDSRITCS